MVCLYSCTVNFDMHPLSNGNAFLFCKQTYECANLYCTCVSNRFYVSFRWTQVILIVTEYDNIYLCWSSKAKSAQWLEKKLFVFYFGVA